MKFAILDGKRVEASKGGKGLCPCCGSELIAKCGEVKVHHWAHKGNRTCDAWWENETDWHRSWKEQFPVDWQEVIHFSKNGEKHIADVKTDHGWVLEFQHSFLNPEERRARDAFYTKLVWVVNGLRRKRDKLQFEAVLKRAVVRTDRPLVLQVIHPEECRILKEWLDCSAPVVFDFRDPNESQDTYLWLLYPKTNGEIYLSRLPRSVFIGFHHDKRFDEMAKNIIFPIRDVLAEKKRNDRVNDQFRSPNRLPHVEVYRARRQNRL